MEAVASNLTVHSSYNISGISFSPEQVAAEIKKFIPDFKITYNPDFRQEIAESWPKTIDDSVARNDWEWKHKFDLKKISEIMIEKIKEKLKS
jgi:nucleoside-diphosphate-sugar epimerase